MKTSETTDKLFPALVAALADIPNPKKTATAKMGQYSYTYATLPDILDAVKPILAKNALAVLQETLTHEGAPAITTRIIHASGEWIETEPVDMPPTKPDPQGLGGALSYARRYSLTAMLSIAGEDDDDGGYASSGGSQRASEPRPPADAEKGTSGRSGTITEKQAKYLHVLCARKTRDKTATESWVLNKAQVTRFRDIPYEMGQQLIDEMAGRPDVEQGEPSQDEQRPPVDTETPCPKCGLTFEAGCVCLPF